MFFAYFACDLNLRKILTLKFGHVSTNIISVERVLILVIIKLLRSDHAIFEQVHVCMINTE